MTTLSRRRRGFTLTELAIVLGVIGIILGAIWVAASKVYQNNRVQIAVRDTETIVQGYRSLFTTHPVDMADGTDITCLGYNSGFFPSDMTITGTTCTGGANTYPQHPWNNYVYVDVIKTWQAIRIQFVGLTQAACNQFAQQVFNAPDIVWEDINADAVALPPLGNSVPMPTAQISNDCAAAGNNYIFVAFKAR